MSPERWLLMWSRRWSRALLLITIGLFCGQVSRSALAGGGPENVLLVVNADNPDSVTVAREYAGLRHIPSINIVELSRLPPDSVIRIGQFRDRILKPILNAIHERKLDDQIDYIVYSAGFPYAVDVGADLAGHRFPSYITQPASLTGLTYLYELTLFANPGYLSLDANWYFRRPKSSRPDTQWTNEDKRDQADLQRLIERLQALRKSATPATPQQIEALLDAASEKLQAVRQRHPNDPNLLYDMGCILALQGKPDDAMGMLHAAYRAGWRAAALTNADPDLASLRSRADYKALLESMRKAPVEMKPSRAFRHALAWGPTGEVVAAGGHHFFLSSMLGYVGKHSNTLSESLDCLRKSAAADGTRPPGTIYFMISDDHARTGPREWAFQSAAEALKKLGVKAEVLKGMLPPNKSDVAGAVIGAAGFDWKTTGSRIIPGAFCDHLTSFGGIMTGGGQTLLSEFLRYGAAGASGTVHEPFAIQAKFPNAFLHVYYASGCSLAEAFYQSVQGPYQLLFVGDPLCRPWARIPTVAVSGLQANETVRKPRKLIPRALGGDAPTRFELFVDGRRVQTCVPGGTLTLDPAGLETGAHEARVVAICGPMEITGRAILPFKV